jgi:hypothetical protein
MDQEYTGEKRFAPAFLNDLSTLSANELRKAYPKESRSYDRLKRARADGFEVAPPWDAPSGFREFLRDMGPAPDAEATVDRIDPALRRYGPRLCRWASKTTQTRNRRNTIRVPWRGQQITLKEFTDEIGIPYSTAHAALRRGESPELIAQRHRAPTSSPAGAYRPAWIKSEEQFALFREEYERWRLTLHRPKRARALPELFDAIWLSKRLLEARSNRAIDELTPDEYEEAAKGRLGPHLRLRSYGVQWIEFALRSLALHDRLLASRLWGSRVRDLHLYEAALLPPPPAPASTSSDW